MAPTNPPLECDLVLKGGLASGVVYPRAIAELARTYRLRSVGGSSAGAIAAAAAACAELGRRSGGFERLATLGDDLATQVAGRTGLLRLFQPGPATRRLFAVAMAWWASLRAVPTVGAAVRAYAPAAALGALPGLAAALASGLSGGQPPWLPWLGVVLALVVSVVGAAAAVAWRLRADLDALPAHGYGLCTGLPTTPDEALTPWLHRVLQECAGRPDGPLVTCGELAAAGIDLRVMTTNVTERRPMALPTTEQGWYFDEAEFRALFPADVVDHLVAHPPAADGFDDRVRRLALAHLRPLPDPDNLPVLVAARFSLSFPLLLSAARLFSLDWADPANRAFADAVRRWRRDHPDGTPEECVAAVPTPAAGAAWFSDGGATSNLPLHFFDAPLPGRPTFAFNLVPFSDPAHRSDDESANSHLPRGNNAGLLRRRYPIRGTAGFLDALLQTMVSWVDEAALVLPGYRDRVVRVYLADDEGGINLAMSPDAVRRLGERGRFAAAKLVDQFAGEAPGEREAWGWANHRWVRLRSSVGALSEWLDGFAAHFTDHPPATTPYADLVGPDACLQPPSYPARPDDRPLLDAFVGELVGLADGAGDPALTRDLPRPLPTMRVVAYERAVAWPEGDQDPAAP